MALFILVSLPPLGRLMRIEVTPFEIFGDRGAFTEIRYVCPADIDGRPYICFLANLQDVSGNPVTLADVREQLVGKPQIKNV